MSLVFLYRKGHVTPWATHNSRVKICRAYCSLSEPLSGGAVINTVSYIGLIDIRLARQRPNTAAPASDSRTNAAGGCVP